MKTLSMRGLVDWRFGSPSRMAFCAALALAFATKAAGTPLNDFNNGQPVADFPFNDASGVAIDDAANVANPAQQFDADADFNDAVTNGVGQFDGSGKANTEFGSVYVNLDNIATGRVLALFEVSWAFDESVFDSTADEEFRLSLMGNEPRSTFVTAETVFTRASATQVSLFGDAVGTGASDTGSALFGSSGSLLTILDVNLDADTVALSYSADGGSTFTTLSAGALDPTRDVQSLRFVLNEDFSDDMLLVERIAVSVIPEPASVALLLAGAAGLGFRRRR